MRPRLFIDGRSQIEVDTDEQTLEDVRPPRVGDRHCYVTSYRMVVSVLLTQTSNNK